MTDRADQSEDAPRAFLYLYDRAFPLVYGYLLSRCGQVALAVRRENPPPVSTAWLVGTARHKLVDHWRRQAREERRLRALAEDEPEVEDSWDAHIDALRARATLARLSPHHRAALTLRYMDDLPVPEVASVLDRSVHATEGLLVRARGAFRRAYDQDEACDA